MTDKELNKAMEIYYEIKRLNHFVYDCKLCWHILRLHRITKPYELQTSYGAISNHLEVSGELAERILKVIEDYIAEKQAELEQM